MNATGCLTALGDGGEAFVVISSDGDDDDDDYGGRSRRGRHRRRPTEPQTTSPRCPTGRPPTPPPVLPMATAEAYKLRSRRKDRGAFVVLPEPPVASSTATTTTSSTAAATTQAQPVGGTGVSGRVSPFRGYGFKTPENGRSRASSPSTSGRLRRQSSESRIVDDSRRPPTMTKDNKRLSASTKDLSAVGKRTTGSSTKQSSAVSGGTGGRKTPVAAGKPPAVPTAGSAAAIKSSPRKKLPPTPRKPVPPKSPLPLRSPKTPRRQQPSTDAVAGPKPTVSARPTVGRPPIRSSPRLPKKQSTAAATALASSKADAPPKDVVRPLLDNGIKTVAPAAPVTTTITTTTTSTESASAAVSAASDSLSSTTAPTLTTSITTTAQSTIPITASTSATAIATTHATNAVASPVVDGGPIVTAVPPPAAIAANTLATLSVIDPSATTLKPPQSAMRSRDPPATAAPSRPAATVVAVDGGPLKEAVTTRQSVAVTMTTTPPLSYELEEIVVEPEIENQSGRTAVRLSVDTDGNKTSSTASSSNGHKTVAWARPSEKIIVPAEAPRSAEPATKDPAYKRYARKLCGGGNDGGRGGRRPTLGHVSPPTVTDGRMSKCWAAVWKRRPRPCGQCCGRKRSASVMASTAEAASGGRRRLQWWRRCGDKMCCCRGKRTAINKKKLAIAASSSDHSVGALGIAPPTMAADTLCGKLKRRMRRCCCCCGWCCGWCAVPKFVKRICCCCRGKSATPKSKSADSQKRSLFKCTGCCTNIPKLDAVFVDHSSVMKGAIPVLPVTLAWLCLVFNVIIPGAGIIYFNVIEWFLVGIIKT
ncbi:mucin-5AC-like [Myzus persicae]|uniref:mucin-5AC-like n=1 Tax=Myzus persicae TaxID=13164 RepID=UPI000B9399A7|nr:mucin-5AC-like [Myzus persicae]